MIPKCIIVIITINYECYLNGIEKNKKTFMFWYTLSLRKYHESNDDIFQLCFQSNGNYNINFEPHPNSWMVYCFRWCEMNRIAICCHSVQYRIVSCDFHGTHSLHSFTISIWPYQNAKYIDQSKSIAPLFFFLQNLTTST